MYQATKINTGGGGNQHSFLAETTKKIKIEGLNLAFHSLQNEEY